jgi:hypothetical protein
MRAHRRGLRRAKSARVRGGSPFSWTRAESRCFFTDASLDKSGAAFREKNKMLNPITPPGEASSSPSLTGAGLCGPGRLAWPAGRKLRALINRRARELSHRAYERYAAKMINALNAKALDEDHIPSWEPGEGPIQGWEPSVDYRRELLHFKLAAVHKELHEVLRLAQILFP